VNYIKENHHITDIKYLTGPLQDGCYLVTVGGANEIGMNFNLFGIVKNSQEQWIIVDAGVGMEKKNGINLVMASIDFALTCNIIGIVCTHAHEDHIGAIPYIIEDLEKNANNRIPIYATQFTSLLVQEKFKEHRLDGEFMIVEPNENFQIGDFSLKLVYVTHSIPEPNMVIINMNNEIKLLHTGDFKLDEDPLVGGVSDLKTMRDNGPYNYLVCDSTNSPYEDWSASEGSVKKNLIPVFSQFFNKRIVISCFSSNIARIGTFLEIAKQMGRKVILYGRSMIKNTKVAEKCGHLRASNVLISHENIKSIPDNKLMIVCTGSQGEYSSVLHKLATDTYGHFTLTDKDVVVFSSKVIPGNEKEIQELKNIFIRNNINVIDTSSHPGIHASGHPSKPEILEIVNIAKPEIIIPVHGDAYHLQKVENICEENNIPCVTPFNGAIINLNKGKIIAKVNAEKLYKDGKLFIRENSPVLKIRKILGEEGICIINISGEKILFNLHGIFDFTQDNINKNNLFRILSGIANSALIKNKQNKIQIISHRFKDFFWKNYGKKPFITVIDLTNKITLSENDQVQYII